MWARTIACSVAVVGIAFSGAPPSFAQDAVVSAIPAPGSFQQTAPVHVTASFDQPVGPFAWLTVVGPDSYTWSTGAVHVNGASVTAPLKPLQSVGGYTAHYRVVLRDGQQVAGSWNFIVSSPELAGL
jgi:methionine-rich copper-binding protein CopC